MISSAFRPIASSRSVPLADKSLKNCLSLPCRIAASVTLVAGALALTAQPAAATSKNVFSTSFTGSGSNTLSSPSDIDVDQSTGDVYVSDSADFRVEKFTASGEFILMFGREVNKTKTEEFDEPGNPHGITEAEENLCTAASGDVCQTGVKGTSPGAFYSEFVSPYTGPESRLFVAVDNSAGPSAGDIYVGDAGDSLVSKFDPEGRLITSWGKDGQLDGSNAASEAFSPGPELGGLRGMAVDSAGNLAVTGAPIAEIEFLFSQDGSFINQFSFSGQELAIDSAGNRYSIIGEGNVVKNDEYAFVLGARNPSGAGAATGLRMDAPTRELFATRANGIVDHLPASCIPVGHEENGFPAATCSPVDAFGAGHLSSPSGVAVDDATGTVYVADSGNNRVAVFSGEPYLPSLSALSAQALTPASEKLSAHVDPAAAGPITSCHFEYGLTTAYGSGPLPCTGGLPISSPTNVTGESNLVGLDYATEYHFHLVAENANGINTSYDEAFTTLPNPPVIGPEGVTGVTADSALVHVPINPGGGLTTYRVEYVTEKQFEEDEFGQAQLSPELRSGLGERTARQFTATLSGLQPATHYRYRVIATNAANPGGPVRGANRTFTTLPFVPSVNDRCPNAQVRQQTEAAQLLDCRAYELVSAANAGGYDVESNLVAGQSPFAGFPEAQDRVLYGVHDGGIPGTGHPTNRGVDPYIASRGQEGWSTEYVGVPANDPFSSAPFSSAPSGTDSGLNTFAFGGSGGCSPCFEGGVTGIPVRLASGELVQGMVASASLDPQPAPAATADGRILKDLSANGLHLIFGSTTLFAKGGNDETGDVSIYDHNLKSGETHVISNTPSGAGFPEPLPCLQGAGKCNSAEGDANGISELDLSSDGSRIVLGQKVSEDAEGNPYYHLYMEVNDGIDSIDLTPGTTSGVLYDGMTADGSKVFFTTKDALVPSEDEDSSADLYRADVSGSSANLSTISNGPGNLGEPGNSDNCDPVENSVHRHWNTVAPEEESCGIVAIGGGGGVASGDGSVYFLSPEQLETGKGTKNAPNLYVARPRDSYASHFVTTLESVLTGPQPPAVRHTFSRNFGTFSEASGLAVEHSSGDVYVLDAAANTVDKFDASGDPVNFTEGSGSGTNILSGAESPAGTFSELFFGIVPFPTQLAVDQSNGDLYVPDINNGVVDKFHSSGKYVSQIGGLEFPTGVAVDPANGDLYVSSLFGTVYVFNSSGNLETQFSAGNLLSGIGVDTAGVIYVTLAAPFGQYGTESFTPSSASPLEYGNPGKQLDANPSQSVAVDPPNGDVYVDEGAGIARYDASGKRLEILGTEQAELSGSVGVAIDPEGSLYASNTAGTQVAQFPSSPVPSPAIDNPLVVDSVGSAATRHTSEFQISANGQFAVFPSTLALAEAEEDTAGHSVLYRYDSEAKNLTCISCTTTGAPSEGESSLASDGLSLLDDGRVFFDSTDHLVSADTDNKRDAYEFSQPGAGKCDNESTAYIPVSGDCLALISAGTSSFDSTLLTATAGGKDALFFTRDSLAPQDRNGPTIKIYDARENGGFPYEFPPVSCRASDECHGVSSPAPGPLNVGSESGTPHNYERVSHCRRGFILKHGRCVRKHKPHRPKRHRSHRRVGR